MFGGKARVGSIRHSRRFVSVALVVGLLGAGIAASPSQSAPLAAGDSVVAGEDFEIAGGEARADGDTSTSGTYAGWPDVATNPAGETLFVWDEVLQDEDGDWVQDSLRKLGRIVGQDGQIGEEFIISAECPELDFGYEPASATWNSTDEEWLVVWSVDSTTLADIPACPVEGAGTNAEVMVGQIVGSDGVLRGTNFVISESSDGSPKSADNEWDDIEHVHARWSPVASAYLVSWKARVDGANIGQRVWATAIDADGVNLMGGQAEDVSGDSQSDDGVSIAYSETSDVFIAVFTVENNGELPGARLMELVRSGASVSINFTTEVFNLHGLITDGDGARGGNAGVATVAWDSSRDEFGVRWRSEDLEGNQKQQHFNVVGADGSYSDADIVKILNPEGYALGGRAGVAYDDVADEWVLVLNANATAGSENYSDQVLSIARIDAADRSDTTPTALDVASTSTARPNIAYLGDGCSVYTWWELGADWGETTDTEAAWAHFECLAANACVRADVLGSSTFDDVIAGRHFDEAIGWMHADGITTGTSLTTFEPNRAATRAEVLTFVWRAEGSPSSAMGSSTFTDLTAGRYYDEAIGWASGTGITTGATSTTFDPYRAATRAEVLTFLWRAEGSPSSALGSSIFTDVTAGRYYDEAIGWASEAGVTTGTTSTTFDPDRAVTRGEAATFLGRLNGCE